uniref:Uncharacterized protein n=1 Tax=Nicotiana tabacum TaxID=4097 RepID=A0A1S3YE94_TOBAC|nr:PREDICTED: uncharacterized protein LOC107775247 [Nicotiana tabacum]
MADESRVSDAGSTKSLPITEDSNTNTIDTQDSKKRKAMQPRSEVWQHFDKFAVNGVDYLKEIDASVTCLRNIVRWNSTYFMLDRAQNFEKAFDKFHLFDDGFSAYLCSHLCEDGSSAGPLESDDWVNVRNVIAFLTRFHELTKNVSGSSAIMTRAPNVHPKRDDTYCLRKHIRRCLERLPEIRI